MRQKRDSRLCPLGVAGGHFRDRGLPSFGYFQHCPALTIRSPAQRSSSVAVSLYSLQTFHVNDLCRNHNSVKTSSTQRDNLMNK